MSLDAMKLALEALEMVTVDVKTTPNAYEASRQAITALRAAIEQAEKQEPHSLLCVCGAEWDIYPDGKEVLASTAPRQWQGLTDDDLSVCDDDGVILARYWEAKLKEKNT